MGENFTFLKVCVEKFILVLLRYHYFFTQRNHVSTKKKRKFEFGFLNTLVNLTVSFIQNYLKYIVSSKDKCMTNKE